MLSASATKQLALLAAAFLAATQVWAQAAGEVTHVSGPMFAVKADGSKRVLSVTSKVEPGETIVTGEKTYSRVKFTDNGEVTLRPDTQFKIEAYDFKTAEPEKDGAVFGLLKGAMRTISGLIGKRGNQDAYKLQTPTATIGIRGTIVYAELISAPGAASGNQPSQVGAWDWPIRLAALDGTGTMSDLGSPLGQLLGGLQLAQLPPLGPPNVANLQTVVKFESGFGFVAPRGAPQLMVPVNAGQTFGVAFSQPPVSLPNPPNINKFAPPQNFPSTSKAPPPPPAQSNAPAPQQQQQQQQQKQESSQQSQQSSSQQQDQQSSSSSNQRQDSQQQSSSGNQQQDSQQQSSSSQQQSSSSQQSGQSRSEQSGNQQSSGGSSQQTSSPSVQQDSPPPQQNLTNRSGCNVR